MLWEPGFDQAKILVTCIGAFSRSLYRRIKKQNVIETERIASWGGYSVIAFSELYVSVKSFSSVNYAQDMNKMLNVPSFSGKKERKKACHL